MGQSQSVTREVDMGEGEVTRSRSNLGSLSSVSRVAGSIRGCVSKVRQFFTRRKVEGDLDDLKSFTQRKMDPDEQSSLEQALVAQTLEDVENDTELGVSTLNLGSEIESNKLDAKSEERTKVLSEIRSNEFLDFYILRDDATIAWAQKNPVMVVMRGLPGSGKSWIVDHLVKLYTVVNGEVPVVCSADHFFIDEKGDYNFDGSKIKNAHEVSQAATLEAIEAGKRMIIVDNTNVMKWEMAAYFKMAEKYPDKIYRVVILEPKTEWAFNPRTLALKNSHGVTEEVLLKRIQAWEAAIPIYFAWFLGKNDSARLLKESLALLKNCLENCQEFFEDFKKFSSMLNLKSAMTYYNRDMCLTGNRALVHCTAKFCGFEKPSYKSKPGKGKQGSNQNKKKDDSGTTEVPKKMLRSAGRSQKLTVIGFVMTKETFGARIALTNDQLEMYDQEEDDKERNPSKRQYGKPTASQSSFDAISVDVEDSSISFIDAKEKCTNFFPIPARGKRAHITLGTSEGAKPVNTGIDLLDLVHREKEASKGSLVSTTYDLPNMSSKLRSYGPGFWALYPDQHMSFDSLFSGHY